MHALLLADVLVPRGPEFALSASRPIETLRSLLFLALFVCWVMVLARLFAQKGVLHGILGILSLGFYPFIWGWMASRRLGIRKIMVVWTVLAVVFVGLEFAGPKPEPRPYRHPFLLPTPPLSTPALPEPAAPPAR
jgi:hypothetical protein